MRMKALLMTAILFMAFSASAETLRCGNKIVDVGMSMADVEKYCGRPSSKTVEEQDVRSGNRVVGKTQLHIWHYNRSSGQNTAVLQFDLEQLVSIDYISK